MVLNKCSDTILIIGASGQGKVVADIAKLNGYSNIVFFDDDVTKKTCGKYMVVGKTKDIDKYCGDVFVAIGESTNREKFMGNLKKRNIPILIHPHTYIADDAIIGEGSIVMAGTVINPGCKIGKGCIINTCSSIDHDCTIGDCVHIAVGAHICGTVTIGDSTWIGAGAIVINNLEICSDCTIGAGAVVVKAINKKGIYIGIPAHLLEESEKN